MSRLFDAIKIAFEAHEGQVDKAGLPYILHPLRVMLAQDDEDSRIAAVLHDTVEDTDRVGLGDILALFGADVWRAVDSVTRRDFESYEEFIQRAKADPIGRKVKLADIEDNLRPDRSVSLPERLRLRYEAGRRALSEQEAG